MKQPPDAPGTRPAGVANAIQGSVDSSGRCQRCGRGIPKPRPRQKACSSRCRWALWKAGQQRIAQVQAERDLEIRGLLEAALSRLGR